jgi:phosphoglycerate kinase
VTLAPDCRGSETQKLVDALEPGEVLLLENLRFHEEEAPEHSAFAAELAAFGDVYINDAFGTAHRAHASMVAVPSHFTEKGIGLLMQKELDYINRSLLNPKKPLCVILGGAKVSSKFAALKNIADKADILIIGGAMANTFLAAGGQQMGKSLYEPALFGPTLELLGYLARRRCKVYLPVDFVVAPSLNARGLERVATALDMPADSMALDIGPATRLLYAEAITHAETILWNGPMGAFEKEEFSEGTFKMVEAVANSHALKVAGGGDTDAAIHAMELAHKFDFISTGGGAFLTMLEGKELPALQALNQ